MKSFIKYIVFLVAICASLNSNGQVNEYLDHNPVWKVNSQCGYFAPCIQHEDYNYYTNGDTLLNSFVYKKIFRKGSGFYVYLGPPPVPPQCQLPPYTYVNSYPEYFVRSSGKQMYLRQPSDTAEYLLYDFNLSVGDTLPLTFNNNATDITVTAIDSFYTPYGYRKTFALSGNSWSQFLLEGVGHSRGFIEPLYISLECAFTLDCFSLNDSSYYPVTGSNCDIFAGVQEIKSNSFTVSPNPFNIFTEIKSNKELKNVEIIICDVMGKEVFNEKNISGSKFKINREYLSQGMYFMKINSDAELIYSCKLVVTD